jgi:hypothetical protein
MKDVIEVVVFVQQCASGKSMNILFSFSTNSSVSCRLDNPGYVFQLHGCSVLNHFAFVSYAPAFLV